MARFTFNSLREEYEDKAKEQAHTRLCDATKKIVRILLFLYLTAKWLAYRSSKP